MLVIVNKITELRKAKNWSQADLATVVDASKYIIGKYEGNQNSPTIEMIANIAKVFDLPVDYLLGVGKHAAYNNENVKRLEDIQSLNGNTKAILFGIIDTYLRDAKTRKAYAH